MTLQTDIQTDGRTDRGYHKCGDNNLLLQFPLFVFDVPLPCLYNNTSIHVGHFVLSSRESVYIPSKDIAYPHSTKLRLVTLYG